MAKQYGLIIPSKNKAALKPTVIARPSIFDENSDSDDEDSKKPTGLKQALKRQDRVLREKAIEEDPTIFQYDEHYDDIEQKRKESKLSRTDLDRKPKYIGKLLQAAERRKKENERRVEREVQRERDAEGDLFKDKESFVTSAYRKQLEEMKKLEEEEKREEYLESVGDVRKQGNLDGFYRHLYEQKVKYEDDKEDKKEVIKKEVNTDSDDSKKGETSKKLSKTPEESCSKVTTRKKRKYRHRKQSNSSSDEEAKSSKHLQSNLDADSDFSIDSGSEEEDVKDEKKDSKEGIFKLPDKPDVGKGKESKEEKVKVAGEKDKKEGEDEKKVVEEEKKPKIDIWKKRTVGEVYEEALQRYFERKAARESGATV